MIEARTITLTLPAWSDEDQAEALRMGWYLDAETAQITADDDGEIFVDSVEAQAFVGRQASAGCERYIRAMILDGYAALEAWQYRLKDAG